MSKKVTVAGMFEIDEEIWQNFLRCVNDKYGSGHLDTILNKELTKALVLYINNNK